MFRLEIFFDEMIEKINHAGLLLDESRIRVKANR